jgi:transcriptional regulator with XRE-family HTH domain
MQSLSSKLDFIREQFGIGTSHLAEALGVGRPTVYAWQKGESKPQDERRDRVEALLALAKSWKGLSHEPLGREMFEPLDGGPSIMQMMAIETPDSKKILEAFKGCLAERAANKRAMGKAAQQMRTRRAHQGQPDLPNRVVEATMRDFAQR